MTSLTQFAYVVFNIYQLSTSLGLRMDTLQLVRAFRSTHIATQAPYVLQSTGALLDRLVDAVEHGLSLLSVATETLPPTVLVSLIFRLMVMYLATRALARLQTHTRYPRRPRRWGAEQRDTAKLPADSDSAKLSALLMNAKEPGSEDAREVARYVAAEGRGTRLEAGQAQSAPGAGDATAPASAAATGEALTATAGAADAPATVGATVALKPSAASHTAPRSAPSEARERKEPSSTLVLVLVRYSRFVLIEVYSHLLLLDQNHQIYWRLLTVFFTLALWSVELTLNTGDPAPMYE